MLPNLLGRDISHRLPSWLPRQLINLGLDLQGGAYLLFEVETDAIVKERLETVKDSLRSALREKRILYRGLAREDTTAIVVRIKNPDDQIDEAQAIARQIAAEASEEGLAIFGGGKRFDVERVNKDRIQLIPNSALIDFWRSSAVDQAIEVVRRRIDEFGTREPSIQRQGRERIIVELPGIGDPGRLKELIGKTARLTLHLVDEVADPNVARPPVGSLVLPLEEGEGGSLIVRKRIIISGKMLIDAQPSFQEGRPVVSFRLDTVGAKRFADASRRHVGRRIAIVLDGKIVTAPVINSPILSGSGIIEGGGTTGFTVEEARDLALVLRAGALPAPLRIIEERTVGPGLGADSIAAGKIASIIGVILVIVFMFLIYGLFGLFASVALLVNIILILGALSALQATLTLPGIAGIVLTMGMAVDANVLIFERMSEEQRAGRTLISAIDTGYKRAMATIIDSNLTTLIAALLLFIMGSGPIRGFAVTLSIGIITSVFTAIMVTRLMVITWLRRYRPKALPIG